MSGGKKPRNIGRHFEQELSKRVQGERAGYGNLCEPDISTGFMEIEAKVMPLPSKLEQALTTVKSRGSKEKLQMVILKNKGDTWDMARVYLSFNDFQGWFGE